MIWLQQQSLPGISPVLQNLGAAVVITYCVMCIVRESYRFAGKEKNGAHTWSAELVKMAAEVTAIAKIAAEATRVAAECASVNRTVEFRLNKLDAETDRRITRPEYQSKNEDIMRQLSEIKTLLDKMYSTRMLFDPKS